MAEERTDVELETVEEDMGLIVVCHIIGGGPPWIDVHVVLSKQGLLDDLETNFVHSLV